MRSRYLSDKVLGHIWKRTLMLGFILLDLEGLTPKFAQGYIEEELNY